MVDVADDPLPPAEDGYRVEAHLHGVDPLADDDPLRVHLCDHLRFALVEVHRGEGDLHHLSLVPHVVDDRHLGVELADARCALRAEVVGRVQPVRPFSW